MNKVISMVNEKVFISMVNEKVFMGSFDIGLMSIAESEYYIKSKL